MRRFAVTAAVFAAPLAAPAQGPIVSPAPTAQMPGTAVGSPLLMPVGTQISKAVPRAAPQVGSPPSSGVPTDLTGTLPGQSIDLANVVAPLPDSFNPTTQPSPWAQFVAKYGASLGFTTPEPKAPNWTPGISRRNHERALARMNQWRRD